MIKPGEEFFRTIFIEVLKNERRNNGGAVG
jgi:hypothetical protein